jgi:hypothetical protein
MTLLKRLKTLGISLCTALSLWTAPVLAAGTTPLSLVQQFDSTGAPLAGCLLYFYVAGTVATPQNAFADFGLTTALPNPVSCDQSGRVPQHWLADGLIHIRLTDSSGVVQVDTTMQVLGPSSGGGGGGGTVDPTTIAATGDLKWRLDKTTLAGWVRINGLTIGSATSGATERANADAQALLIYIWQQFSQPSGNVICPVVGGIGSSALADFNANKQITLEDARARTMFALDDMGNTALGGFSGVTFSKGTATTGGASGGVNATTLTAAQIPVITSSGSASVSSSVAFITGTIQALNDGTVSGGVFQGLQNGTASLQGVASSGSASVASNNTGGQAFPMVSSALLGTLYWKL